jgi:hypothetical protein
MCWVLGAGCFWNGDFNAFGDIKSFFTGAFAVFSRVLHDFEVPTFFGDTEAGSVFAVQQTLVGGVGGV